MLEVSDSLILAQQETHYYPITKAIFAFANRLADGTVYRERDGRLGG